MSYISVDVESDGEAPGLFSMVCFGAVVVEPSLSKTFYGQTRPITNAYKPDALAISGFSRQEHEKFDDPLRIMTEFDAWIKANSIGHPIFITDNPAFDFAFINYYFHWLLGRNPFGYSARRIGDLYCGLVGDTRARWKHLRREKFEIDGVKYKGFEHTHDPLQDCLGNAHVLLYLKEVMELNIKLT